MGLDGLRGLAALIVVVHHIAVTVGSTFAANAQFAVDFFFLLSGFVIARSYEGRIADGRVSLTQFAALRIVRLYPAVLLALLLSLSLHLTGVVKDADFTPGTYLSLLLLPSFSTAMLFPLNPPLWSLLMELLANAGHAIAVRGRPQACAIWPAIAATLAGAVFLLAMVWADHGISIGPQGSSFFGGVGRIGFSYSLGVLLFRVVRDHRLPAWMSRLPLASGVLLLLCLLLPVHRHAVLACLGFILILSPLILIAGLDRPRHRVLVRLCQIAGEISYPLYATHMVIFMVIGQWHLSPNGGPAMLLFWTIVLVLLSATALAIARCVETPIMDRFRAKARLQGHSRQPAAPL